MAQHSFKIMELKTKMHNDLLPEVRSGVLHVCNGASVNPCRSKDMVAAVTNGPAAGIATTSDSQSADRNCHFLQFPMFCMSAR
jgi:hypothetical protein